MRTRILTLLTHLATRCYCFLCPDQIPKWTRAKYEIATAEPLNPLKQDEKAGVLRSYKWGDMMFNYGALPQTWEDPAHADADTRCCGDNDPLDAIEFGYRAMGVGQCTPVKVLGVLAMIDDGEADWKLIVLRCDDPLAQRCADVADLERELPGAISAVREWLRVYKQAEGKGANAFALGERAMPAAYARGVIAATHAAWGRAHGAQAHKRARAGEAAAPAEEGADAAALPAAAKL
jgi:inorganic pyrophosphatase